MALHTHNFDSSVCVWTVRNIVSSPALEGGRGGSNVAFNYHGLIFQHRQILNRIGLLHGSTNRHWLVEQQSHFRGGVATSPSHLWVQPDIYPGSHFDCSGSIWGFINDHCWGGEQDTEKMHKVFLCSSLGAGLGFLPDKSCPKGSQLGLCLKSLLIANAANMTPEFFAHLWIWKLCLVDLCHLGQKLWTWFQGGKYDIVLRHSIKQ